MPSRDQDFTRFIGTQQQPQKLVTPKAPEHGGLSRSTIDIYQQDTLGMQAGLQQQFQQQQQATGASLAAQRAQLADRQRFGLAHLGLDREGLGLDQRMLALAREGLGISRQEADIGRRDMMEAVINNALQRGIFQSGIRLRNMERAEEMADIQDARLDVEEGRLDVTGDRLGLEGRRLGLRGDELRSSIKHAIAALNANAKERQAAEQMQRASMEAQLLAQRDAGLQTMISEAGGIFEDDPVAQPVRQAFTGYSN